VKKDKETNNHIYLYLPCVERENTCAHL